MARKSESQYEQQTILSFQIQKEKESAAATKTTPITKQQKIGKKKTNEKHITH